MNTLKNFSYEDLEFILHELCCIPCTEQIKRISNKLKEAILETDGYKRKKEVARLKREIDEMSQEDMARKWRFAPIGHRFTENLEDDYDLKQYFSIKFKEKGGMTSEISKSLGWED